MFAFTRGTIAGAASLDRVLCIICEPSQGSGTQQLIWGSCSAEFSRRFVDPGPDQRLVACLAELQRGDGTAVTA